MNPWKDIASYGYKDALYYKGREEDLLKFSRILSSQGIASVIYADSGIGKSSFLDAGVAPSMIEQGYYPVHIVFNEDLYKYPSIEKWLINYLKKWNDDSVFGTKAKMVCSYETFNTDSSDSAVKMEDSLWWHIHTYVVRLDDNDSLTPYYIFDQFEELFAKCDKYNRQDLLVEFFDIVEKVCSDFVPQEYEGRIQELLMENPEMVFQPSSTKTKVTFSLRKEYLSLFDYWTNDRHSVPHLMRNRMLLLPLTRLQAERVMLEQPSDPDNPIDGPRIKIFGKVYESLLNYIDSKHKDVIEPFIISIICSRLYLYAEEHQKEHLSEDDLKGINVNNLLETFYQEAIDSIIPNNPYAVNVIESTLVDPDTGNRNRIRLADPNFKAIQFKDKYFSRFKDRHLIRSYEINDETYVEIVHDRIANIVANRILERKKKKKYAAAIIGLLSLAVLTFLAWLFISTGLPQYRTLDGKISHKSIQYARLYKVPSGVLNLHDSDTVYRNALGGNQEIREIIVGSNTCLYEEAFRGLNIKNLYLNGCNNTIDYNSFEKCNIERVIISDSFNHIGVCRFQNSPDIYIDGDSFFDSIGEDYYTYISTQPPHKTIDLNGLKTQTNVAYVTDALSSQIDNTLKGNSYSADHLRLTQVTEIDSIRFRTNHIDLPKVKKIGASVFEGCYLKDLYLPSLEEVNESSFSHCYQLRSIYTPKLRIVGQSAFEGCDELESFYGPDVEHVRSSAFNGCSALTEISLPSAKTIEKEAFSGCNKLQKIEIPSLESIDSDVFRYCNSLDTIITNPRIADILMSNTSLFGIGKEMKRIDKNGISTITLKMYKSYYQTDTCEPKLVETLIIPRNINRLNINSSKYTNLKSLKTSWFRDDEIFSFKDAIYLVLGNDAKDVVLVANASASDNMVIMVGQPSLNNNIKKLTHFAPQELNISPFYSYKGCELVVPYGYSIIAKNNPAIDTANIKITELSLWKTILYRTEFSVKRWSTYITSNYRFKDNTMLLILNVFLCFALFLGATYRIQRDFFKKNRIYSLCYVLFWILMYIPCFAVYCLIYDKTGGYAMKPAMPALISCTIMSLHIMILEIVKYRKIFYNVSLLYWSAIFAVIAIVVPVILDAESSDILDAEKLVYIICLIITAIIIYSIPNYRKQNSKPIKEENSSSAQ